MTEISKRMSTKTQNSLYSKVIGFGGDNRLDKFIDNSIGLNQSAAGPESPQPKVAELVDSKSMQGSNLARMGHMSLKRSTNILTDAEELPRAVGDNPYSFSKLQRVKENMETEDAFKYRANTVNRGYGFAQSLSKAVPAGKAVQARDEANPYEYNFASPGNY